MKIKPHFTALVTYLSAKESPRTTPVSSGFRCDIKFPFDLDVHMITQNFTTTDIIYPGDTTSVEIALLKIENMSTKIYEGLDFDLYEGFNIIGHGVVTQVFI